LPNVLKVVLSNAVDAGADTVAFEAFLREEPMPTLEKALKHREQKLKKVSQSSSQPFEEPLILDFR
jgi:hypothetical protein